MKPKIALISLTGCGGCELSLLFTGEVLLDLVKNFDFRILNIFNKNNVQNQYSEYEAVFVSGLVADKRDIELLQKYRKKSKILIALGACSVHGNVYSLKQTIDSTHKNQEFNSEKSKNSSLIEAVALRPISEYVKVDFSIPGCPPDSSETISHIKDIMIGKKLVENEKPVCFHCSLNENFCLLKNGKECIGPLIKSGCDSLCPSFNKECTGCRGPINDGNIDEIKKIFSDKGISFDILKEKISKYAKIEFDKLMNKENRKKIDYDIKERKIIKEIKNNSENISGQYSVYLDLRNGKLNDCRLEYSENSILFEEILKGKHFSDIPEIVSRMCGITSCFHVITSIKAIENAFNIQITEQTKLLRELLAIGELIRSHSIHIYLVVLPNYFGFDSGIEMMLKNKKETKRALELINVGNSLIELIGGRVIHPVTFEVGYNTYVPEKSKLEEILKILKISKKEAIKTSEILLSLDLTFFERKTEYISLRQLDNFPSLSGDIISTKGLNINPQTYRKYFNEVKLPNSKGKLVFKNNKTYFTGALARVNNNSRLLCKEAETLVRKSRRKFPNYNPLLNNFAQSLEIINWIDRAIEIITNWDFKEEIKHDIKPKSERGIGVTESPQGLLIHDYEFNSKGCINKCSIITPTAQIIKNLEEDIKAYASQNLTDKQDNEIRSEIEMLVKSYGLQLFGGGNTVDFIIKRN